MASEIPPLGVASGGIFTTSVVVMAVCFGLLTLAAGATFGGLPLYGPVSFDTSVWYASHSLYPTLFVLGLVLYGLYTSLGGRRVFDGGFLDMEDGRSR